MFPTEKAGIDGPSTGSNHCQSSSERCQNESLPRIAGTGESNPNLDACNYCPDDGGPQADKEKYPRASPDYLRHVRGV